MHFDNINHETGDYQSVIVPCPCVDDCTGEANKDCPYCCGQGRLWYMVYDLEFIEESREKAIKETALDELLGRFDKV